MINRSEHDIMKQWGLINNNHPLASIQCIAYNQEKFIADTINGLLLQETDFPFEIVIHDDASTDKTADIIRKYAEKYPNIIKPIFEKENQYSKKDDSLTRIMNAASRGKYVAFCEGDDFWIHPQKLQMQIDLMENDSSISLVHSDFTTIDENGNYIERIHHNNFKNLSQKENELVYLFKKNHIMTLTTVVKRDVLNSEMFLNCPHKYDYAIFFSAAFMGKIRYIPQKMGAYRKVSTSLMNSQLSKVSKCLNDVYLYFVKEFIENKPKMSLTNKILVYFFILYHVIIFKRFSYVLKLIKANFFNILLFPFALFYAIYLRFSVFLMRLRLCRGK